MKAEISAQNQEFGKGCIAHSPCCDAPLAMPGDCWHSMLDAYLLAQLAQQTKEPDHSSGDTTQDTQ
eukprot:1157458-Pelagomonas_calceolata.AAC.7